VSTSELQPGDLVFFYGGIEHVGIYVGGGTFVHAANPGDGVVADQLFSSYWMSVLIGAGRV
jgi:cell wall-associated NlpC family hydrolase